MPSTPPPARILSRRKLLGTGGGAALSVCAGALAACGATAPNSGGQDIGADVEILNGALDIKHLAIASYGLLTPALSGRPLTLARQMLEHELSHARALTGLIVALHATPNQRRAHYGLHPPSGAPQALGALAAAENEALAFHVQALPSLSQPHRALLAAVAADDAMHLAVLQASRGRPPAPDAFVVGRA